MKNVQLTLCEETTFSRLAKNVTFVFVLAGNSALYRKTGQRSARLCGIPRHKVQGFGPWLPVRAVKEFTA